jgi:hypothetical protein
MKRFAAASLLLSLALPIERATAQQVIDFNNANASAFGSFDNVTQTFSGGVPYNGFVFAGPGSFGSSYLLGHGDGFSLLMHSATPFTLISALFQSAIGTNNQICVAGYTATDHIGVAPQCGLFASATYTTSFFSNPGSYNSITFNWPGVTTLAFDSRGGPDPNDPSHSTQFNFYVDDVTISAAPEPASMALLATGLIGIAAVRRRRWSKLLAGC